MAIFFPDLSSYQGNLRIQPGTVGVVAKATEGLYYKDSAFWSFKQQTDAVGGVFSGYHFLIQSEDAAAQARFYFNFAGSIPCMLDVENEGSSNPGVPQILQFAAELRALGGRCWGAYVPHWFWQNLGSPSLLPLAQAGIALVSSSYTAYSDNGPGWDAYGGVTPAVWQYTDALPYGGGSADFNAFKGSVAEFAALVNGTDQPAPAPIPVPAPVPEDDLPTPYDVWAYSHNDNPDVHQTLMDAKTAAEAAPMNVWAFKNPAAGDTVDMRQRLVDLEALVQKIATKLGV